MAQVLSPEELVRWCQQTLPEDHRAFEQLMAQYKGLVFNTALRLMGNAEDAEDQAQEAFFKVYNSINDLDEPATLSSWLSRITINTCLDALRRQRRLRVDSLSQFVEDGLPLRRAAEVQSLTPETMALARELRACLEQTLHSMSDIERTILVLRDIEDCSYQDMSEMLKVSLSAIKMRVRRTRLAFQQLFRRLCPGLWRDEQFGTSQGEMTT